MRHMSRYRVVSYLLFFSLIFSFSFFSTSVKADSFDEAFEALDRAFEEKSSRIVKDFQDKSAGMEEAWDEEEKRIDEEWERMKEAVEQKWDDFADSTKKVWVDYDIEDQETRSQVNFEEGKIVIETVIPVKGLYIREKEKIEEAIEKMKVEVKEMKEEKVIQGLTPQKVKEKIIKEAEPKIAKQIEKILGKDEKTEQKVLADQIADQQGKLVDESNKEEFIQKEILPKLVIEETTFTPEDGIERVKVKVEIPMISGHLRIRASKYQDIVNKYAAEYDLDPCLLYAVTETESYFNPMAKSSAGAYGLMQLIPRYGAREAYQYLYNKDTIISPTQLYIPGVNVCLGGAYLKILRDRYYKDIADQEKNKYLSIASYNWGPTAVRSKIVKRINLDEMGSRDLFHYIREHSPDETGNYLKKVTERMPKYQSMTK